LVDRLKIVKVGLAPPITPIELCATLKFPPVPVETAIWVPAGFPFAFTITETLVVYTLNPVTVIPCVRVVVEAVTNVKVVVDAGTLLFPAPASIP
jgi:hypothetical protein